MIGPVYCALIALTWSQTSFLLEPVEAPVGLAAAVVAGGAAVDEAVDGVDLSPQPPAKNSAATHTAMAPTRRIGPPSPMRNNPRTVSGETKVCRVQCVYRLVPNLGRLRAA